VEQQYRKWYAINDGLFATEGGTAMPRTRWYALVIWLIAMGVWVAQALAQSRHFVVDLTHPIPTFQQGDVGQADLSKPFGNSRPIASFSSQAVLVGLPNFPTGDGHFTLNRIILGEHHGTHLDAPGHFANKPETTEMQSPDRRTTDQLESKDLTGPVVLLDIARRVQAELDKNGGTPDPDAKKTNFSDASGNVVTAADIDAIASQLADGVWLIVHTGWSRFYWQSGPGLEGPYINGFNFPGVSKAAIDRLIALEEQKKIRINGLGADQIQVDTGANAGAPQFGKGTFPGHVRGLQRGWKMLENLANTELLAQAKPGSCTLFVGALKHVGGSGGAARVFAQCERP
jgi:kynurenine formamidase